MGLCQKAEGIWMLELSDPRIIERGRTLTVESEDGVRITFIGKDGAVLLTVDAARASYTLPASQPYVRAKVTNAGGKVALTQAYFPD